MISLFRNEPMENKKIRICYLVSSLCNEGPVNVMYNIITNLDFLKFEVSIITLIPEKKNSRFADFAELPISIFGIEGNGRLFRPISLFFKLKSTLEELRPEILHAHCPRSLFLLNFLPSKWVKTYTVHIYPGLQQRVMYGRFFGTLVIKLSKHFIKQLDYAIACAENVKEEFLKNDKIVIGAISNGGTFAETSTAPEYKHAIKIELGLDLKKRYFIFIGRFSKEKNPDFLIDSFKKLSNNNIGLIMLGDGPMFSELRLQATDNIIIPGFRKNVRDYIQASDYYVSSSSVEGLANTLLETMAIGLPFLLTEIPPHLEVIRHSQIKMGETYILNDFNDFQLKINLLFALNVEEAANALRICYQNNYTSEIMSKKYQNLYQSLINE